MPIRVVIVDDHPAFREQARGLLPDGWAVDPVDPRRRRAAAPAPETAGVGEDGRVTGRRPTSARFAELDWRSTPMGDLTLRRRHDPVVGAEVYEVLLGDDFLMSSTFTHGEVALARLGLEALGDRTGLDVMVGGLGLGYTAGAVLEDPRVRRLHVVEALEEVIDWHRRGLLPLSPRLTDDPRCALALADFFGSTAHGEPLGGGAPQTWDAVLVDIDHSPRATLHPSHAPLYEEDGLRRVRALLRPGGVFALWSDDPPDEPFTDVLRSVFPDAEAHVVDFANPLTGGRAANTVYVAPTYGECVPHSETVR